MANENTHFRLTFNGLWPAAKRYFTRKLFLKGVCVRFGDGRTCVRLKFSGNRLLLEAETKYVCFSFLFATNCPLKKNNLRFINNVYNTDSLLSDPDDKKAI